MGIRKTDVEKKKLVTSREPDGPKVAGQKGSDGDLAVKDAVIAVITAWAILFGLVYSLRKFNV